MPLLTWDPLLLQFFEFTSAGEIQYNTRAPEGCAAVDNVSTYLTIVHCSGHLQPVPPDQKFEFRKVTLHASVFEPACEWPVSLLLICVQRAPSRPSLMCGCVVFFSLRTGPCSTRAATSAWRRCPRRTTASRHPACGPAAPQPTSTGSLRRGCPSVGEGAGKGGPGCHWWGPGQR